MFTRTRRSIREGPKRRTPPRRKPQTRDSIGKSSSSIASTPSQKAPKAPTASPRTAFGLTPSIKLKGPMALARERSDHVLADLEAHVLQNAQLRVRNAELSQQVAAKDLLLNRNRDTHERAKTHNAALRVQIEELKADLMAANAHGLSISRVHEDALEDHARAKYDWDLERQRHDAAANAARDVASQLSEAQQEISRIQTLYDTLEGERDDLRGVIKRLSQEVSLLRHVRAQKDKHVALLAKEKQRLEGALLQQRKKTSRRISTRSMLARSGDQQKRRERLEKTELDDLIGQATAECSEGSANVHVQQGAEHAVNDGSLRGLKVHTERSEESQASRQKVRIRASATMALRDKLAVLAGQVRAEKERNAGLEKEISKSRKANQDLRTRLRNSRPSRQAGKQTPEKPSAILDLTDTRPERFLSP